MGLNKETGMSEPYKHHRSNSEELVDRGKSTYGSPKENSKDCPECFGNGKRGLLNCKTCDGEGKVALDA